MENAANRSEPGPGLNPQAQSDVLYEWRVFSPDNLAALAGLGSQENTCEASAPGHMTRVGRLAFQLSLLAGLDLSAARMMRLAAGLHDAGKRFVPEALLMKAGPLTAEERSVVEEHAEAGGCLFDGDAVHCRLAAEVARFHHEWWNGCGYPSGLAGRHIPLSARIVSIVDVFDALISARSYKAAWPVEQALDYLEQRAGTQFDPDLCLRFVNFMRSQRAYWRELSLAVEAPLSAALPA